MFVPEDLEFMRTTAARLGAAHERLVALVAHDRASLGGMLLANGWAVLLSALWGHKVTQPSRAAADTQSKQPPST